jgi:uncharacterized protein (DUF362 family)
VESRIRQSETEGTARRLLTRRDLVAGSAAAAALGSASCNRQPKEKPRVSIVRAAGYTQDLFDKVKRLIAGHGIDVRGKRVVLKPNLVEFDPGTTINTHPLMVHAALEAFRSLGAAGVRIAEGPGHRRVTLELAEAAGYFGAIPGFESLFTDLNLDEISLVELRHAVSKLSSIYLSRTPLTCDLLVSMPKMKTHHWVGATLSMKNFFGIVPGAVYGWPKNVLHWAGIDACIADLHNAVPRHFAIVDGIVGMEGNGPIQGTPKSAGVIVGGSDLVAVDATCCRIMGINPERIQYLRLAERQGQTNAENVTQAGESIASVRTRFELLPEFRSYRLKA